MGLFTGLMYFTFIIMGVTSGLTPMFSRQATPFGVAVSGKYEEIERLSENIGKLYLVAQANAQAIMSNSKENAELTNLEVEKNLSSIDEAHDSLNTLRDSIVKTSDDFVNEVNNLLKSLDETREKITQNTTTSEKAKEQFETVYESIVNN